jgi:hypothetical protein
MIYYEYSSVSPFALRNVREIILRRDSSVKVPESLDECENDGSTVGFFKEILPNLDILDIGDLAMTTSDLRTIALARIALGAPHVSRVSVFRCIAEVIHHGCRFSLMQPYPFPVSNIMNSLREIHLDPFGVHLNGYHSPLIAAYGQ